MSEECSSNCGSCSESCSSRQTTKADFLEPANENSHVKKVIGVVSGKGGVGKSFITSYLSVLLKRQGYQTAILDADITGPSIPKAFGIHEKVTAIETGILPAVTETGIKLMSVNLILEEEDTPVIWRGPVIAGTVKQFWSGVIWEDVDYMFVDMPPGTGDVPLTVYQSLPLDGIIIVTSPQQLVSMIVSKAIKMAEAMEIPILGIIENYSYISCTNCKEKVSVFGESHAEETANKFGIPLLGRLPIDPEIVKAIDSGKIENLQGDWLDGAVNTILKDQNGENMEETVSDEKTKIAITTEEGEVIFQHFGRCSRFTIYELAGNTLLSKKVLESNGAGHEELAVLLKENNIDVLICGGIGEGAINALTEYGIRVVSGMQGDIDVAAAAYLDGDIKDTTSATCTEHDENHSCAGGCGTGCGGCH